MNVLLLVFTMLSLLTIMTYTRLQTFLDAAGVRIEYESFMSHAERKGINNLEKSKLKSYKVQVVSGRPAPEPSPEDQQDKEFAIAMLNVRDLFSSAGKKGQDLQALQLKNADTIKILQKLMEILYGDQRFYKEALVDYPQLTDTLIQQMLQSIPDAPCQIKFTDKNDLAKIPLIDQKLREVFVKMLNGQDPTTGTNAKGKVITINKGFDSLLKYLTVKIEKGQTSSIRVFLARKALLQAIFRDPQPIIERRKELYDQVKKDILSVTDASKEFSGGFKDPVYTDISLNLLNFDVSKTPPPND